MKKFSIIAIQYNQPAEIHLLVKSILKLNTQGVVIELIIVDDGSDTKINTETLGIELKYIYLERTERSGRANARNEGAKQATGDYLVFIDGDSYLNNELIIAYNDHFERNPRDSIVLGTRYNLTRAQSIKLARLNKLDSLEKIDKDSRLVREVHNEPNLSLIPGGWIYFTSCNFCILRSTFQEIGGFNTYFTGWGCEDLELGYRLHKSNYSIKLIDNPTFHTSLTYREENIKEKYYSWLINIGKFYELHQSPNILDLMEFERLINNCMLGIGRWEAELEHKAYDNFLHKQKLNLHI